MHDVKSRLDAWRVAEHRRDGFVVGSSEWQAAQEAVDHAAMAFHAEEAQEYARYAEEAFGDRNRWSALLARGTFGVVDPGADAILVRWRRRLR